MHSCQQPCSLGECGGMQLVGFTGTIVHIGYLWVCDKQQQEANSHMHATGQLRGNQPQKPVVYIPTVNLKWEARSA